MQEPVLMKPAVQQQFQSFMHSGRILFFSAPCGFGKTAVAHALLSGEKVLRLSAEMPDFSPEHLQGDWNVLLIDDFQEMQEERDLQALYALIRASAEKRFVILSRGAPPGYLQAFQYAGLMTVIDADDLLFDREDTRKYFADRNIAVTDSELSSIQKQSIGYPLGVVITARCMSGGKPFGPEIVDRAYREVFSYFETAVYRRSDLPVRRFLLELAPFESFDLEMARMVSGDAPCRSAFGVAFDQHHHAAI